MKADFYTSIKSILAGIAPVKVWNTNLLTDSDRLGRFPLLFLEFNAIKYETTGNNIQECNGATVTVHILYKTIDSEDSGVFTVSQQVYAAMQRAGFSRLSESPNYTGTEIIDWQITFEAPRWIDSDAKQATISTPAPAPAFDITLD